MNSTSDRVIFVVLKRCNLQAIQIYAATSDALENETEQLYEDIRLACQTEKAHFCKIFGYFNAKVGSNSADNIPNRGSFDTGQSNERGETLTNSP